MSKSLPPPAEDQIRSVCEAGELAEATSLTLRLYGAEVFGFLLAVHRNRDDADDAFSLFYGRLWQTLGRFAWNCSLRTWVYLLARNASAELRRGKLRGRGAEVALTDDALGQLPAPVRSETLSMLRTEKRTAFAELCLALPPEDRELLVLRVDRGLAWREVALVLAGTEGLSERALVQEAARLRKRFQLVREKLRELGRERGLLH